MKEQAFQRYLLASDNITRKVGRIHAIPFDRNKEVCPFECRHNISFTLILKYACLVCECTSHRTKRYQWNAIVRLIRWCCFRQIIFLKHCTYTRYKPINANIFEIREKSCYIVFAYSIVLSQNTPCDSSVLVKLILSHTFLSQKKQHSLLDRRLILRISLHERDFLFIFAASSILERSPKIRKLREVTIKTK